MFLFLIIFSGGLFDMIIVHFHWKYLHFSFFVKTCLTWRRKKFLSCFILFWDHFVCVFMNIFGFSLKTEIPFAWDQFVFYYEFCISIILAWCLECLVLWKLFHTCLGLVYLCIYEHIWIFIENWNPFCMRPLCLLLWILFKYYFGIMCWMSSSLKVV